MLQGMLILNFICLLFLLASCQKGLSNETESGRIRRLKVARVICILGIICSLGAVYIGFGL